MWEARRVPEYRAMGYFFQLFPHRPATPARKRTVHRQPPVRPPAMPAYDAVRAQFDSESG